MRRASRFTRAPAGNEDRPKKILFVETTDVSVSSHLSGQLGYLKRHGFNVSLIASDTGLLKDLASSDGVTGISVRMKRDPSPISDLRSLWTLFGHVRRLAPTTIVYGTPKASLLASVVAFILRVPNRVYFLFGLRAETMTGLARTMMITTEKLIVAMSTEVLSVGDGLSRRACEMGIQRNKIRVQGHGSANGVDVTRYAAAGADPSLRGLQRSKLRIPVDAKVVGFVGRVTSDKGIDALVEAVAEVRQSDPNVYLLIAGPDEGIDQLAPSTQRLLREPWVRQAGNVLDTAPLYAAMEVFCFPSLREGLPTVLLEASAAGVPIVATDATGVSDIVQHDVTGIVVPIGDVVSLHLGITKILRAPAYATMLARQAHSRIADHFDQEVVWENLRHYYCTGEANLSSGEQRRSGANGAK